MIYFVFFCISVLFAYMAKNTKQRSLFIFLSLISILATVMLAGLRDVSVGIDTRNYYKGYWAWAMKSSSLGSYLKSYMGRSSGRFELFFVLLARIIAKTTGSFHAYLIVIHLIIVGCVYIGAFRMREHADPTVTLLLFYLLYYNHSLNISRQYIAMAIVFAGLHNLEKRRYGRYIIYVAVATLFHTTGILGLLSLVLFVFLYPRKRLTQVPLYRRVLACVIIVVITASFVPAARALLNSGFLSAHFKNYFLEEKTTIAGSTMVMLASEAALLLICWKQIRRNNTYPDFFLFCSVSFIALYQIAPYIFYGKRIAAYFSFINILTLGMTMRSFRFSKNKLVVSLAIICFAIVYWMYFYYYKNGSGTMPYIIGI